MSWGISENCRDCTRTNCTDMQKIREAIQSIHHDENHNTNGGSGTIYAECWKKEVTEVQKEDRRMFTILQEGKYNQIPFEDLKVGDVFQITDILNGRAIAYYARYKATSEPYLNKYNVLTIKCEIAHT